MSLIKIIYPRLGIEIFRPFGNPPSQDDVFYLGFDEDIDLQGHILRFTFNTQPTQATGIKREDPPLVWECSIGNELWVEIEPSTRPGERDSTGGLNNPQGDLSFYLPLEFQPNVVQGLNAYWIRCRFEQRRPEQGQYSQSPQIEGLIAHTLGSATMATHAIYVYEEYLGISTGEPGQEFQLQNSPVLPLSFDETLLVEERQGGEIVFVPWQAVPDFSQSTRFDRHYVIDQATGEIMFGPAIRQPDGAIKQYGRIAERGRQIIFNQYRYGGGAMGQRSRW